MLDQLGHAVTPKLDVRLRVQPYVGVEADQALAAFALDQAQQCVANRLHHQRKRADVQSANLVAQCRQVRDLQQAVSTAFAAKAVLRRAIGTHGDHCQRGRRRELHQELLAHAFVPQHLQQAAPKEVGGQSAEQPGLNAQATQPNRDVERRPAGNRFVIDLGGLPAGILFAEKNRTALRHTPDT